MADTTDRKQAVVKVIVTCATTACVHVCLFNDVALPTQVHKKLLNHRVATSLILQTLGAMKGLYVSFSFGCRYVNQSGMLGNETRGTLFSLHHTEFTDAVSLSVMSCYGCNTNNSTVLNHD